MHFSITGYLGSGKTTICKKLQEQYGFERIYAGGILRELAKEKNMTILEFTKYRLENDEGKKYDKIVDDYTVRIAKENPDKDLIFDSRLAWHFIPDTFKIFVLVSPYEAALRTYLVRKDSDESYSSLEEARDLLVERRIAENRNYKKIYGVNCEDLSQYDLVIDTTSITTDAAVSIIMDCYNKKKNGEKYPRFWISPSSLFPTKPLNEINMDKVKNTFEAISEKKVRIVEALRFHDSLFILDGHGVVLAYNLLKESLINPVIVMDEEDIKKRNINISDIIKVTKEDIDNWAKLNGFAYNYYPRVIEKIDSKED
ncbi:MAG: hypothetical protein E7184_01610 [Erysipelotrichaceae bacterium]|nr:hypothetical protein [Erysipelotrichaceae bacterium]